MARAHGQIRQSQMITTFGPGALVDLPRHAAIIGGLDTWQFGGDDRRIEIQEARLAAKVQEVLKVQGIKLYAPPADSSDEIDAPKTGVTAYEFPVWFVAQMALKSPQGYRSRPLVHRDRLQMSRKKPYEGADRQWYSVVPVRFVQACQNGHVSDINWWDFVHLQGDSCRQGLFIDEKGTAGDLSEIEIRCDCGKSKPFISAFEKGSNVLGWCRGHRPWLGADSREFKCHDANDKPSHNRLLIRSASNAYFPQVLSVISIPDENEKLQAAVGKVWEDFLQYLEVEEDLPRERKKARVHSALEGFSNEIVWREVQRRRMDGSDDGSEIKKIRTAEIETLLSSAEELGEDKLAGDFFARTIKRPAKESGLWKKIDRVVLVHRLREVVAQVGFTRFEPPVNDYEGELSLGVQLAPLAEEVRWVPAVENRGEGVFVSFKKEAINAWGNRPEVQARKKELEEGFNLWAHKRNLKGKATCPPVSFIMLHSLSHLLITAVALDCGYSSSAIRERVYAGESGYGILLYTGTPDSEGTLGGLVQVGKKIEEQLRNAVDLGRLCSNDPVCAQHSAKDALDEQYLLGAACHGCLLIAETSCERFNQYLDRSLVVSTVGNGDAAFFSDSDLS